MELTVREAATLTGRSPRTLRAVIQRRAEEIRHAVDEILPSRATLDRGRHRRSLCDLDAFLSSGSNTQMRRCCRAGGIWTRSGAESDAAGSRRCRARQSDS